MMVHEGPRVNPRPLHDGSLNKGRLIYSILAQPVEIHKPIYLLFRRTPVIALEIDQMVGCSIPELMGFLRRHPDDTTAVDACHDENTVHKRRQLRPSPLFPEH